MNSSRLATLIAVVVIFAVVAGTWFIGIAPRLGEAANAEGERETAEFQNTIQQATLDRLVSLDKQLPALKEELAGLRLAVPGDAKSSSVFSWLNSVGAAAGVTFDNIVISPPETYAPVVPDTVGEESEAEPGNPELQAAQSLVASDNFFVLPIQFDLIGTYAQVSSAIATVQSATRYVLVYEIAINEGLPTDDTVVTATVKGQIFVLLDSTGVPVAAEPSS